MILSFLATRTSSLAVGGCPIANADGLNENNFMRAFFYSNGKSKYYPLQCLPGFVLVLSGWAIPVPYTTRPRHESQTR